MAAAVRCSALLLNYSGRGIFFLSISITSAFLLFRVYYSTTRLHIVPPGATQIIHVNRPILEFSLTNPPVYCQPSHAVGLAVTQHAQPDTTNPSAVISQKSRQVHDRDDNTCVKNRTSLVVGTVQESAQLDSSRPWNEVGSTASDNTDVYHDRSHFLQDYSQMNKSLQIYTYAHKKDDPFANVLLPRESFHDEPGGNYASEACFKSSLFKSHFLTNDPSQADLFYLPFSIASLRYDRRIGVNGIQDFIKSYITNISLKYPFWNWTGGADHFYVACHSVGRTAMEKAVQVKLNAIQVVCSSSYFLSGYVAHKDASIPQIWPRKDRSPPTRLPSQRKRLAFYAGEMNSRVREFLVRTWENDSDILVHSSRVKTPYSESLLGSKFCIHAKGFEVNTARIGDAVYYGCVPVILADHYDLPYADILNWKSFSVVVPTMDIPKLKVVLLGIGSDEYLELHRNVKRVQKHFLWHHTPVDYDAFHMVMYELWLRRSHAKIHPFD